MAAAVFANLGIKPKRAGILDHAASPKLPPLLAYLWGWFGEFAMGMASGGMGPAVATWEGLTAWCARMRVDLEPWEAKAMIRLGHIRAVVQSETEAERQKAAKGKRQ